MEFMVNTSVVCQPLMSWSKASASSNMEAMAVTLPVFQSSVFAVVMALLNNFAPLNMEFMVNTSVVCQPLMSWSKASASSNMEAMVVTLPVSQPVMSPLNLVAPLNMFAMSVTLAVFQSSVFAVVMALLNAFAPLNMEFMVVTLLVRQPLMSWSKASAFSNMEAPC